MSFMQTVTYAECLIKPPYAERRYAKRRYAERRYAERCYTECRSARLLALPANVRLE
jgi:hypothetical protein